MYKIKKFLDRNNLKLCVFNEKEVLFNSFEKAANESERISLIEKGCNNLDIKNGIYFVFRFREDTKYGLLWGINKKHLIEEEIYEDLEMYSDFIVEKYKNNILMKKNLLFSDALETLGENIDYSFRVKDWNGLIVYDSIDNKINVEDQSYKKIAEKDKEKLGEIYIYNKEREPNSQYLRSKKKLIFNNKLIGKSSQMRKVNEMIDIVSTNSSTVIIRGESGTGKEEIANLIHRKSSRYKNPFIPINCGAIPENLLESELFGYEGGAFTGANKNGKIGKFEAANKGTLFLDEIGDMSENLQVKLLRTLQEKSIQKVGGNDLMPIDVRIICATNKNLEELISKGEFREDLYYRINVIPIIVPSLEGKEEDIKNLICYYTKKHCLEFKKSFKMFDYDTLDYLVNYNWPGNIRELINVVEYSVATSKNQTMKLTDLPKYIIETKKEKAYEDKKNIEKSKILYNKKSKNKHDILKFVDEYGHSTEDKRKLADDIGISLATLYRWIKSEENKK
ncbi:MAG: sigma 54-interacting transcriptional regulator [Tissierellales bacterium]|nr:sigma 54-interacting transcriptional regulator [Tissierellales bacterium]